MMFALIRHARRDADGRAWDEPPVRRRLAQLATDFEVARMLLWRAIGMFDRGEEFRAQAAMVKLFNTELAQRLYTQALSQIGPRAAVMAGPWALWDGAVPHSYLSSVQDTIGAGTSEVQREIIALRGLGLPRG
jgi:alkylation response protein AidB-like acyl-CoA dehydrogenase